MRLAADGRSRGIQEGGPAAEAQRKGANETKSPLRLDDLLGGCGRLRMLRFLPQVTAVLEPGCGSEDSGRRGRGGGRARISLPGVRVPK